MSQKRILCSLVAAVLLIGCIQLVTPIARASGNKSGAKYSVGFFRSQELKPPVLTGSNDPATGKIKLTWESVSGAEKYQIWRSATGKQGSFRRITTVKGTSFTAKGTDVGVAFYYKIKAVRGGEQSQFSNRVFRTCDLPQPNISLVRMVVSGKTRIRWESIQDAIKYEVWCSSTGVAGSYYRLYTTKATQFIHKGASPGELFYYKVRAIHQNGKASSGFSEAKSRTCTLPRPIVTTDIDPVTKKVVLSWAPLEGCTKYAVYYSLAGDNNFRWLCYTTHPSHIHKNGIPGKAYDYKVYAMHHNPSAKSAYSAVVTGIAQ